MHVCRLIGVGALIAGASLASAPSSSARSARRCEAQQLRLVAGFQGAALGSFVLFYNAPLIPGRTDRRSWSVLWHR
jgi:hypothetical protein